AGANVSSAVLGFETDFAASVLETPAFFWVLIFAFGVSVFVPIAIFFATNGSFLRVKTIVDRP
ncbi:MAG: hypothetical protein EAY72_13490, partial [Bacteroidetes bacterium]